MTVNILKTFIVTSESDSARWRETLKDQDINVRASSIVVYEDGASVEEVERLIAAAKSE